MRSRIITIISGHFKSWYRSKSHIFWTIAFPLLLIVLFGAIFSNGSTKFDLYLQNQDLTGNVPTPLSQGYVNVLNQTGAFNLHMVAAEQPDPLTYVKNDAQPHNRGQRLLVIPLGFNATLMSGKNATVQLFMDQSDQASASLAGIVRSVTISYAAAIANAPDHLVLQQVGIVTRNIRYIDFFIPGVIGMTLLTTGVFGAANTITFPMMFLAGTFWPRETLPDIMKIIANFMPLTYVNDGLRDALIYAEPAQALTNTLIALGLAAFFIALGSILMNWKEE